MDLIHPEVERLKLWDATDGVFVEGLEPEIIENVGDVLKMLKIAKGNRKVSFTKMNAESSRSHCVLTFTVSTTLLDGTKRTGKLNFGDLAGCEKTKKTGAIGERLEEAKAINKSLSCLGAVMKALVDGREHVNYRDSKLTFMLKDSLGGNCKTTLMTAVSPHVFNCEETISTLRFAQRAKKIKTLVVQNEVHNIKSLLKKNDALKARIGELEKALQGKGILTSAETQSLKISFQETFESDSDEERSFRSTVLKEIRGLKDFNMTRVETHVLSNDPYTLDVVFHPTEFAPQPGEYKNILRNLFYGGNIETPLLSDAELIEEMDLSLKRKYESDIAELQQANETLKADMDKLSGETQGAQRELMKQQFLFVLNHASSSDVAEMKSEWVSAKKKMPVIKTFLEKQEQLVADKCEEARNRVSSKDPTMKKIGTPIDDVLNLFDINAELHEELKFAKEQIAEMTAANENLTGQVEKLKRFITGQEIDEGESTSQMFGKDPMTKLGSLFRFFTKAKEGGVITKQTMESGLAAFGVYLSTTEMDELFDLMDSGSLGEVNYNNFLEFMDRDHAGAHLRLSQFILKTEVQKWMKSQWEADISQLNARLESENNSVSTLNENGNQVSEQKVYFQDRIQGQERAIEKMKEKINEIEDYNMLVRQEEAAAKKSGNNPRAKAAGVGNDSSDDGPLGGFKRLSRQLSRPKNAGSVAKSEFKKVLTHDMSVLEIQQGDAQIQRLEDSIHKAVQDIMHAEGHIFQLDQRLDQLGEMAHTAEGKVLETNKKLQNAGLHVEEIMEAMKDLEQLTVAAQENLSKDPDQEKLDTVTGLLNRYEFDYALKMYMQETNFLVKLQIDNFDKFNQQHAFASKKLKQIGDVLKDVTRNYDDVYFYRVGNLQFSGIFLESKLETVHNIVSRILDVCKTDTELELSVGLSPFESGDSEESWLSRCEHSMSCSVYTRQNVIQTLSQKGLKEQDSSLKAETFEDLDADMITIGLMLEQIEQLETSNKKLSEIFLRIRTQNLTGVISQNVDRASNSIKELKHRAQMLRNVNSFDRKFMLSFCSLYNIFNSLEYIFEHQHLPDFANIQERIMYIESMENIYELERCMDTELQKSSGQLELKESIFDPTKQLFEDIHIVMKEMRHDAGRRSRDMQRDLIVTAEKIFDEYDDDKVGYLPAAHCGDFLEAIGIHPNDHKLVKVVMDRDREGRFSKVDFLLWLLSVEYDATLEAKPYGFKLSHQDKRKQLYISGFKKGNTQCVDAGIEKWSRILMIEEKRKFKTSAQMISALKASSPPLHITMQVISAAAQPELANQGLTKFIILQNLLAESPFNGPQMNDDFEDDFSDELPGYSADDASDVQSEMSEREARKRVRRMSYTSDMSGPKRGHRLQVSDMSAASTKSSSRKNTAITCQDDIVSMKSYKSIQLGEQVQLSTKAQGMVKYIGKTAFSTKEIMFGIETQGRFGEHDGYLDGLRYFIAGQKKGLFVKRSQIKKVVKSLAEQMENREKGLITCIRSGNYVTYNKVVDDDILKLDIKKVDKEQFLISLGCKSEMSGEQRMILHDLISRGANMELKHPRDGLTPLALCAKSGNVEMCELFAKKGIDLNTTDEKGWTPLMYAAVAGHEAVVKCLCENECSVNAVDKNGRSVVHHVALKGMTSMFKILMKRDADPNIADLKGQTPLMLVCADGMDEMVSTMLYFDVDKNLHDINGKTALMLCAAKASPFIVDCLCNAKADINAREKNERTAVMLFAVQGKTSLISVLISHGADLNLSDKREATALHYACGYRGHTDGGRLRFGSVYDEAIRVLVKGNADIDSVEKTGKTPLIVSAAKGSNDVVEFLVKFGAKRDIVDEKGKTALQTACQLEFLQVANTLLITPNYADRNQFIERVVDVLYKDMGFMGNSMFVSRYTKAEILHVANLIIEFVDITPGLLRWTEKALSADELREEEIEEHDYQMKYSVRYAGYKECCGTYHWVGMSEQSPKYEMVSPNGTFLIVKKKHSTGKSCLWYIVQVDRRPHLELYCNKSDSLEPSSRGWSALNGTAQPFPVLYPGPWGHWFAAAESNDVSDLEELLTEGVHIDLPDKDGFTAASLCAGLGLVESLDCLLMHGSDMNVADFKKKDTAVHQTARAGYLSAYDCLLKYEVDANIRNARGYSAADIAMLKAKCRVDEEDPDDSRVREAMALIAAKVGNFNEILYALDHGIERTVENAKGQSLIRVAIMSGNYNIANFILSRNIQDIPIENFNEWFQASTDGNVKSLVQLNKNGVHVDLPNTKGQTALMICSMKNNANAMETLSSINASADAQDYDGRTATHIAATAGKKDIVEFLISTFDADVNIQDNGGNTPLHTALLKSKFSVARTILKTATDIEYNLINKRSQTCLMLAVSSGSKPTVEYMLNQGASFSQMDELGRSALALAIKSNFNNVAMLLVKAGASLSQDEMDSFEDTWFIAAEEGNMKSIQSLMLAQFDVTRQTDEGQTAVMMAAQKGHTPVLTALLSTELNLDKQETTEGNTALHYACVNNHPECVALLCDANATRHVKNLEEKTPFDLALELNHVECVEALKSRAKAKALPNQARKVSETDDSIIYE